MGFWRLALAAPLVAAAAVCPTARHTSTPGAPVADRSAVGAAEPGAFAPAPAHVQAGDAGDFDRTVKPILEKGCRPCHFTGGVMYGKLPFDRAETIRRLGERLFTRIKAPEDQAVIRTFLTAGRAPST